MILSEADKGRFWEKVDKVDGKCWGWTACKDKNGYGILRVNRKNVKAHRIMWYLKKGEIPKGLYVCHHCDNPQCVNPGHLFIGNNSDNMRDCVKKGRYYNGDRKGSENPNSKLNEADVCKIRLQLNNGNTVPFIARQFKHKVSPTVVYDIKKNKTWQHITLETC